MSEKRFTRAEDSNGLKSIFDNEIENGKPILVNCIGEVGKVVDLLNELNEKNQRLKNDCSILIQSNQEYRKENEQLKQELQGMEELLQSYRKTIKHDAELLADASKKGYLPPLNDYVSTEGWICGCCKHFHSGVRDRCDKDNNWVLKDGSCQDFER